MDLSYRQQKIQDKRKQTPWRDFVMEICSWYHVSFNKFEGGISRYHQNSRYSNIYSPQKFNLLSEEDFSSAFQEKDNLSFIENLKELLFKYPKRSNISVGENVNCEFGESIFGGKNCYLSIEVGMGVENILYSTLMYVNCKNVLNGLQITSNSENIYYSKTVTNSLNIFFSKSIHNSNNIRGSSNLVGCNNCILCNNLENQSFYFKNKQLSKDEFEIIQERLVGNFTEIEQNYVNLVGNNIASINVNGEGISFCENIINGYYISRFSQGRNIVYGDGGDGCTNFYDGIHVGINSHHLYAVCGGGDNCNHVYCSVIIGQSSNIYYSYDIMGCSFCVGCMGLRNKSYCILNKQYTKEERYEKVDEIFSQMEQDGTLGEFFPATMNPFYFNDTAAYLIDPSFTKEEVTAAGYLWRDKPITVDIPAGAEVVKMSELDQYEGWRHASSGGGTTKEPVDSSLRSEGQKLEGQKEGQQRYIDSSILKKIIQDPEGNVYRIVPMEYEFLMKHGLPLPRKHRLDRMKENFRIT